jgi:hypothetical protein
MRDSTSLHQKVQEMCDCYATKDPLKEMSKLQHQQDADEAAIKWVALAILHGINNNAEEISIQRSKTGSVKVVAEYRKAELPSPPNSISDKIIGNLKDIIHADSSQSDSVLAFGFRDNSMDLRVRVREESGSQKVTLKFP